MNEYIVLENIPNTPEGKLFLRQLRKYLRPQYRIRSRGRNKDRKGLAKRLAAETQVRPQNMTEEQHAIYIHHLLRAGMSCKHADRITTVIEANNTYAISYRRQSTKHKKGFYLFANSENEQGPFSTWHAAKLARIITQGANTAPEVRKG